MLLSRLPSLLLLSTDIVLAAPVKEASTVNARTPNKARKTQHALEPALTDGKTPLTDKVRQRLYQSNRFDSDGREMTRVEWDQKLKDDPTLLPKWNTERREKANAIRRRNHLREMIKSYPEQASIFIQKGKNKGFQIEDLIPGG
jgi:hypothetical protein